MSILHIMLVKRLVSIVWDPKDARDDTEAYQIKNDPRSWELNFCNCVRSLKKNQDFNGRYGNEPKTSVLLKGFGRSMARIVRYGVRGVPLMHQSIETTAPDPRDIAGNLTFTQC